MEDSFKVRVDKAFGSLSSSSSSASFPLNSSLWCLSDEELDKKPWSRESESLADDDDDDDPFPIDVDRFLSSAKVKLGQDGDDRNPNPNPSPSPSPGPSTNPSAEDSRRELEDDLRELDDDAGEGTSDGGPSSSSRSVEAVDDEEREEELDVRSSIGMDCTLDFEEEEDEYDKVAVGKERTGERLYMSDVIDYVPHLAVDEIPDSFKEAPRDPRANHLAAQLRLKEDAEAARSFNSLHVSEPSVSDAQSNKEDVEAAGVLNSLHVSEQAMAVVSETENNKEDVIRVEATRRFNSLLVSEQTVAVVSEAQNKTHEDGKSIKSILKRKEDQMSNSKSEKRVRFESGCKDDDKRVSAGDQNAAASGSEDSTLVPDYIRNPSRYKHYTFDSLSDMNEESNRQAYMDFLNMIKKSKQSEPKEVPADLSKPVVFNPKKKAAQIRDITMEEEPLPKKSLPVHFASQNRAEDEATEMEVDDVGDGEQETVGMKLGSRKRAPRQYRLKRIDECTESDT